MFALRATCPRGSLRIIRRSQSRCSARWLRLSSIVSPGTWPKPPTMTLPTSPSAWAPTTLSDRLKRTGSSSRLVEEQELVGAVDDVVAQDGLDDGRVAGGDGLDDLRVHGVGAVRVGAGRLLLGERDGAQR